MNVDRVGCHHHLYGPMLKHIIHVLRVEFILVGTNNFVTSNQLCAHCIYLPIYLYLLLYLLDKQRACS